MHTAGLMGNGMDEQHQGASAVADTPLLRRFAEVLLGPITLHRRLPKHAGGGRIVVNGKVGGLKYIFRPSSRWDPKLLDIAHMLVRTNASVWDVGANVGLFASAAAFHAGREGAVLAIEADFDAVALLNQTRKLHEPDHAPVTILPVAVSNSCGVVKFDIARRARATNAIQGFGSTQTGGVMETRTLPCATLDSLLAYFRAPDVLKIDVEGAELGVLRGASQVLGSVRPFIYCEVQGNTRDEAVALLTANGYRVMDGDQFDGDGVSLAVSDEASNLLAIPSEKMAKVFPKA